MDDIELETRSMVDEGAELKHGVTCLRSRPIENSLISTTSTSGVHCNRKLHIVPMTTAIKIQMTRVVR